METQIQEHGTICKKFKNGERNSMSQLLTKRFLCNAAVVCKKRKKKKNQL